MKADGLIEASPALSRLALHRVAAEFPSVKADGLIEALDVLPPSSWQPRTPQRFPSVKADGLIEAQRTVSIDAIPDPT